jgi:hypothetical protein
MGAEVNTHNRAAGLAAAAHALGLPDQPARGVVLPPPEIGKRLRAVTGWVLILVQVDQLPAYRTFAEGRPQTLPGQTLRPVRPRIAVEECLVERRLES